MTKPADFAAAERIVNSDPVIKTFAAPEWDELTEYAQLWCVEIIREATRELEVEAEKWRHSYLRSTERCRDMKHQRDALRRELEEARGLLEVVVRLACPIVDSDLEAANDFGGADWISQSQKEFDAIHKAAAFLARDRQPEPATNACSLPDSNLQKAQSAPVDGWRPIETAPKDGTWFLAWFTGPYQPSVKRAQWEKDEYARTSRPFFTSDDERIVGKNERRKYQPTHWMPLPPAPQQKGPEDE